MAGSDSSSLARATCAGKTGSGVAEGASSPNLMKRYLCGQKCSLLGKCQEHATATRLQQVQQLGSKFSKTWRNSRIARQSSMRKQVLLLPGILGRSRPCRHVETCRDHLWHWQQRACRLQKKVASWYNAILHLTYNPCDFTHVTCNHVTYLKALEVPVLWTESCRSLRRCWRRNRSPESEEIVLKIPACPVAFLARTLPGLEKANRTCSPQGWARDNRQHLSLHCSERIESWNLSNTM